MSIEFKGRFQPDVHGNMIKCDDGGYVCAGDYEALRAERDLFRDEASVHKRKLESAEAAAYANGRTIASEEVDRLRAENAELHERVATLDDKRKSLCIELDELQSRHLRECAKLKRSAATDEYTRRIRAEAIREAVTSMTSRFSRGVMVVEVRDLYKYATKIEGQGNG